MKTKLLAVIAAFALLTGCQADYDEKSALDERETDIEETQEITEINGAPEEKAAGGEMGASETEAQKDNGGAEKPGSADLDDQGIILPSDGDEAPLPSEIPGKETDLTDTTEARTRGWTEAELATGIPEACRWLFKFDANLNSDDLQTLEVEKVYDVYWILEAPYTSLEQVQRDLETYFTPSAAETIINTWELVEYDGKVLAPERSTALEFHPDILDLKVGDVQLESGKRYANLSTVNAAGESVNSLMRLTETEDGRWVIDTMPGQGKLLKYGDRFVRDSYWATEYVVWHWPEFISSRDEMWTSVLRTVRQDLSDQLNAQIATFEPLDAFKQMNVPQLRYWVNWSYGEKNPRYPYVDIVLSEYVKYSVHPNHSRMTVNMSAASGQTLALEDVYVDQTLFEERVNVYIDGYMRDHRDAFYDDAIFSGINSDTQFYLTDTGIVFYFQLYEYAPYAYGYPEIEVPFEVLSESLIPELRVTDQLD